MTVPTEVSDLRRAAARVPVAVLAGSILLASVLLSSGIWSWFAVKSAPRVGTWTETGTVIQLVGDSGGTVYIGSPELQAEYTLDASEFDSPPQIAEGDQVTVWVATVQETVYSPFWGRHNALTGGSSSCNRSVAAGPHGITRTEPLPLGRPRTPDSA